MLISVVTCVTDVCFFGLRLNLIVYYLYDSSFSFIPYITFCEHDVSTDSSFYSLYSVIFIQPTLILFLHYLHYFAIRLQCFHASHPAI